MAPLSSRVVLKCDNPNCPLPHRQFTLMPCEARKRVRNKTGVFHNPRCYSEFRKLQKEGSL